MPKRRVIPSTSSDDHLWYKDAIIYELHIRAFSDSDGDGVGDIRGLIEKLDYLHDLGITTIWLLPFYPSPLKDDGYDISDYTDILPVYGTMTEFKNLVEEAHDHGLRVITEMVINHTSDQHPWFQRARRASPTSRWRDFYVWSDNTDKYQDARIIFKDSEYSNWAWDNSAKAYYWHRFYSHQPDLNYDNHLVRRAVLRVVDFWLKLGVDGLRVDAVPYLYEREGTNCENLPETHAFLKELRQHIDEKFRNRMLLAEANQWPEDAAAYFGHGDESNMAFHFPLMPRMFMSIRMEDRFPIVDILQQTPPVPESCQWALFLRNHDELTLEMVTDEERDYMYRVYAADPTARLNLGIRRRLAPLLNNDRRKIELMKALLFSLPGTPVIYYGDEIGMGDNFYLGDRNGVRTPMQWSPDRNAGFSQANPQKLYLPPIIDPEYHYETINVETQQNNPDSFLWWLKRLIALRKRYKAFGRGSLEFLHPDNRRVLAFIRRYQDELLLIVANLSHMAQQVHLDLSDFKDKVPMELFGRTEFSPISGDRYSLTLAPYGFFWFSLEPEAVTTVRQQALPLEEAVVAPPTIWKEEYLTNPENWYVVEDLLTKSIVGRRWFRGKARPILSSEIEDVIPMHSGDLSAYLILLRIDYKEGESELYTATVAADSESRVEALLRQYPQALVAYLESYGGHDGTKRVLYDAMIDERFCSSLVEAVTKRRRTKGERGQIVSLRGRAFKDVGRVADAELRPVIIKSDQTNTSAIYGKRLILKLFRRIESGLNPEIEIGRFLTEKTGFQHTAPFVGALQYRRKGIRPMSLAILSGLVPNEGDAWQYTLDSLERFFKRALTHPTVQVPPVPYGSPTFLGGEAPQLAQETIGAYLSSAQLLAQRTAELHISLASVPDDPEFAPEPFSMTYQKSVYHSMRSLTGQNLDLLEQSLNGLPDETKEDARTVLNLQGDIIEQFEPLRSRKFNAARIRCHGDYHLGQVLYTGRDFAIIDFEGEPARPLSERRLKRSPLRDVAGMVRSFDYAAHSAAVLYSASKASQDDFLLLERWGRFWYTWVSAVFLSSYLETVKDAHLLPEDRDDVTVLLNACLLEKAVYEIGYELNNRPAWLRVPIRGILQLLEK